MEERRCAKCGRPVKNDFYTVSISQSGMDGIFSFKSIGQTELCEHCARKVVDFANAKPKKKKKKKKEPNPIGFN